MGLSNAIKADASDLAHAADSACNRLIRFLWALNDTDFLDAFDNLEGLDIWDEHTANLEFLQTRFDELKSKSDSN